MILFNLIDTYVDQEGSTVSVDSVPSGDNTSEKAESIVLVVADRAAIHGNPVNVTVSHSVDQVTVGANVDADIVVLGNTNIKITDSAIVKGNVTGLHGADISVAKGAEIYGSLTTTEDGTIVNEGTVHGDLKTEKGDIRISGVVGGTVTTVSGTIDTSAASVAMTEISIKGHTCYYAVAPEGNEKATFTAGGQIVDATQIGETNVYRYVPAGEELSGMLYATAGVMPFADFYYGEMQSTEFNENDVIPVISTEDKVSSYRAEGMYDAVTTATTIRGSNYSTVAVQIDTDAQSTQIEGLKDIGIAIHADLLVNAVLLHAAGIETSVYNKIDVESFSETPLAQYKVLLPDGTCSAWRSSEDVAVVHEAGDIAPELESDTVYGDYEIGFENLPSEISVTDNVLAVLAETQDHKIFGFKQLENTWIENEIGFSTQTQVLSRGGTSHAERYEGLEGNTIRKLTFLLNGYQNYTADVDLYIPVTLRGEYYTAEADPDNKKVIHVTAKEELPADSDYQFAYVRMAHNHKQATYEETATGGILTFADTPSVGNYSILFQDQNKKYGDICVVATVQNTGQTNLVINSSMYLKSNDRTMDLAEFIRKITNITVTRTGSSGVYGNSFSDPKEVFDLNDPNNRKTYGKIIHEELLKPGEYTVTIEADGYADSTITYTVIDENGGDPGQTDLSKALVGEAEVKDFDYSIKIYVTLDESGTITSVTDNDVFPEIPSKRSQQLYNLSRGIFEKFNGISSGDTAAIDAIDVVSGATVSSNAIRDAVKKALASQG